ncbi:MAG: DUF2993 domain-containing protein [Armatimonadetes bacterium]|nr:DUF2993 domain-containing protein [Armatimonadota bacterium]
MSRHCIRFSAVALVTALAMTSAWAAMTPAQVASRMRSRMMHLWTISNLRIAVSAYPGNANLDKGAFKQIKVTADSITVSGVKMTQVLLQAQDVVLDIPTLQTKNDVKVIRRGADKIYARVSEADLNRALTHKKCSIENMRVKLGQGKLVFTGKYRFGLSTSLMLQGRLEVPDGYHINFVPTKASVGGLPLPATPLRTVLNRMNPLLDLKSITLSPRIDRLIVQPGYMIVQG